MTLGTQTQPYGKLLDYEQFIDHQLARTRARIKLTDMMTAGLTLLVGFLAVLFIEVVLDHIVGMPLMLRRIVLTTGLSTACAFSALRLVMPLMRRVNSIYAAKTIENTDSGFKNSLINYLELRRHRGLLPKTVMATIEARAVNDLTHVEIDGVVNQQRLMKMAYSLSAVIVVICLYSALTPKSVLDSAKRAFLADIVRPTNTQLLNIKPGDNPELSKAVAGDNVNFAVNVEGTRPGKVVMHYSVDGGKFFAVKEFLPGRHMYDPWQVLMNNVQQSMDYYLTAGDAESLPYHLEVLPAPTITSVSLDLKFPGYTKVEPRLNVEGGNIEAIEGTDVVVHAKTNMPASTATLNPANKEAAPMEIASDDATVLSGKIHVDKSGTYTIKFRTTGGQLNPNPVVYEIFAIPDRPPTAQFIQPAEPTVKVPANVKVDLDMRAIDDHGVKDATLHVALGNEILVSKNLLEGQPPQPEFRGLDSLDLAKLKVKPGAVLNYWLTVKDNKEPYPNKGETPRQIIEVIEPVSPTSKRQFEENQKKEREQLDPSPPATQDEPQTADKPPANQQRNPDEPANDAGAQGQEKNPGQVGAQGTDAQGNPDKGQGNVDGANRDPQNADAKDNSKALSPEQLRDMAQKIGDKLKNKGTASNPANKGGTPNPDSNPSSSSSDNSAAADAARSRDQNTPAPADKNAANRPQQGIPNRPTGTNPPTPPGNNNPTDSSSQVAPGVRDQNPPAVPPGQNDVPNPNTTPPGGNPQMGNKNGGNGTSGGTDNQAARPGENPAGLPNAQAKSDSPANKKATPNDRSDSTQRDPSTKAPADDRQPESQDPGSPQAPQAGGTKDPNGSAGAESKTGRDRVRTKESDRNTAAGKKPASGDMNKAEDGKPETDPAKASSRDGHEGAGKDPSSTDKSRDGQSKTKPGDTTDNPDGPASNPDSKPGSEGSSPDSKSSSSQGAEAAKTAHKDQSSDRSGSNEAGKNKNKDGARPSTKSEAGGESPDSKPGEKKSADGTEPNSDAKEGSGSKPGDSPDGSPKAGADQKPGSNTSAQSPEDAMKANDPRRTKAAPTGKEAGDRESQPGTGQPKGEPKDKPVTDGQAADPSANPESTPGTPKSKAEPKDKPGDYGKAADPNANLKKKPRVNPAAPSEMNDSKAPGTSKGPKDPQAKGDQDQPAGQKAMEKAGQPKQGESAKAKETGKTGANPDPQDAPNKDAHEPKDPQTPRARPENGVQEPKNPEDPAALQDPKKDPSVREPRNTMPADARKGESHQPKEPQKAPDEPVKSDQEPKRPQDPVPTKDRKTVPTARDPRNAVPADERNKEAPDPNAPQTPKAQPEPSRSPNQSGETRQQNPDDKQQPPKKPQTGDMQERQGDNPPSAANADQAQPQEDPTEKRKGASQRKTRSRDPMKADRPPEDMRQRQGDLDRLKPKPKPEDEEKTEEEKKQEEEEKELEERKKPRTSEDTPLERQNPGRPNDRTLPPPAQERDRSALPDRQTQAQSPDQVRNSRQTTRSNSPKNMPKDAQQSSPQLDPSSQTGQPGKPQSSEAGQTRQEQTGKSGVSGEKIKGKGSESGKEIDGSEKSGGQGKPSGEGNEPTSNSGDKPGGKPGSGESTEKSSSSEGGKPGTGESSQESSSSQGGKPGSGGSQPGKRGSSGQQGSQPGQGPGEPSGSQGGGRQASEPPSADRPGQGAPNSNGGGGNSRSGGTAGEPAKDNTQPTPRATEPENAPNADNVAPKGASQTDLNLRTLQDVLKDPERAKNLEKDTGLNREQLEQFVRQYEKMKSGPAGPGREIEVKPGEQSGAQPSANLPGVDPNTPFAPKTLRGRETQRHDDDRNNLEGVRFQVPSEWRAKYQGYKNKLSKPPATKPKARPSSKPGK